MFTIDDFRGPKSVHGALCCFEYGLSVLRLSSGALALAASFVLLPVAMVDFSSQAHAACRSDALGTSRTIVIDAAKHRHIKGKEASLGLKHKEVILTFDDGPIAGKTPRILKALKKECVKATFFYVGKMARAYPKLVRRVVADGHTLAHHTHSHNALPKYSTAKASSLIDRGVSQLQKIAYNDSSSTPRIPFFRYPYLARNKRTDRLLARKGLIAFGANIDAVDWKKTSSSAVHNRIMRLLRKQGKGIILMHDIQHRTAKMLPRLLRSLKNEGYKVVHMVAKGQAVPTPDPFADTLVMAKADKAAPISTNTKPSANSDDTLTVASLEKQADREVALLERGNFDVKNQTRPAAKKLARKDNVGRTGVSEPAVVKTASLPVIKAKASAAENQLKPAVIKKSRKVKKKRGIIRRKAKKRNKRSYVVVAKTNRSKRINVKNWKLRRSQWILR